MIAFLLILKLIRKICFFFFLMSFFIIFASVRVTRTSKAMQTTAIGTVANSLPENEVILLTLLISKGYILIQIYGIILYGRWFL